MHEERWIASDGTQTWVPIRLDRPEDWRNPRVSRVYYTDQKGRTCWMLQADAETDIRVTE